MTDVGLQGVFNYRHLFPPFSITSSVMSSVTSFPEEGEVKGLFIKKAMKFKKRESISWNWKLKKSREGTLKMFISHQELSLIHI